MAADAWIVLQDIPSLAGREKGCIAMSNWQRDGDKRNVIICIAAANNIAYKSIYDCVRDHWSDWLKMPEWQDGWIAYMPSVTFDEAGGSVFMNLRGRDGGLREWNDGEVCEKRVEI